MSALPKLRIGEIVLATARYDEMKDWYRRVLDIAPYHEHVSPHGAPAGPNAQAWASSVRFCFFRVVLDHPYQQVVALFEIPGLPSDAPAKSGLHHMQLRDESPAVMARRLASLRDIGIVAFRARDHGPTTSFYFQDPDHNVVEIAAPNMANLDEYLAAALTEEFAKNPSGRPVDLEQFIANQSLSKR